MGTLQHTLNTTLKITVMIAAFGGMSSVADASKTSSTVRIAHAKQLLGNTYNRSAVRNGESIKDVSDFVERMTKEWLPDAYSTKARTVATAIIRQAEEHSFDPIFILAVIQNESMFNPSMRGNHTEIGLMQIKPTTAKWVIQKQKLKIKYTGDKTLLDPVKNIKIGVAFMSMLREQFESHSPLYISAYNMGARRVRQIVADDRMPKDYVQAVMKRYVAIYGAFGEEKSEDLEVMTKLALQRVREATRAVASN